MPLIDIDTVGRVGLARDERDYRLDPTVWTHLRNMRCQDGELQTVGGREQIFANAGVGHAPVFLVPVRSPSQTYWVWTSLTGAFAEDGATRGDITRAAGATPYTAVDPSQWNATFIGGILILNNGQDVPQYWATPSLATDLANLTNWPTTLRAKVVRAVGNFLVAVNLTDTGVERPHRIRWAHPADPGSLPSSWDPTDPTKSAGEKELSDTESGILLDALALRGQLFLYKESSTWRIHWIGGSEVFDLETVFETSGILAPRCVSLTGEGQRHFVATQDDVIVHDGIHVTSVFEKRLRRHIFATLDSDQYTRSFTFINQFTKEACFCWPEEGNEYPNRMTVWNYGDGTTSEADCDFIHAAVGPLIVAVADTWDTGGSSTWDEDDVPWSAIVRRRLLVADRANLKIGQYGTSNTNILNAAYRCEAQRTGIAVVGQKRDGTPQVDFNVRKMVKRLWPRIEGGPVNIRMGAADIPDGPVTWQPFQTFNPDTQQWIDLTVEGKSLAIEFMSEADVAWHLEGYKLDLDVTAAY